MPPRKWLLIGLGNPGVAYQQTRHNLGQRFLKNWQPPADSAVTIFFPDSFMNESGPAVARRLAPLPPEAWPNLLIVHDELDIPLGEFDFKTGSANGHKGVRSIHNALGTNAMPRLRFGIGRPQDATPIDDYVLQAFSAHEEEILETVWPRASESLEKFILSMTPPTSHA